LNLLNAFEFSKIQILLVFINHPPIKPNTYIFSCLLITKILFQFFGHVTCTVVKLLSASKLHEGTAATMAQAVT